MIKRDSAGKFIKGNTYWLGRKGKKPNSGSFKKNIVPWNKGKHTIKVCENCGKEFSTNKINLTKPNQRFCSIQCVQKYRHNHNNQPRCKICNKKIGYRNVFCKECYKKENHHFWKGGITPLNLIIRNSLEYLNWRKAVFERDNYTCQKCFKRGVYLQAHHIKPFSKFPDDRLKIDNGLTLCRKCHKTMEVVKRGKNKK